MQEHLSAIPEPSAAEAIRAGVLKALDLLVARQVRDANEPRLRLLVDGAGKPMFQTVRDKLGDIMRVYRAHPIPNRHRPKYDGAALRAIRAEKGVGRPPKPLLMTLHPQQMADITGYAYAVKEHGSQRAAARALGINLSTFQRRLAKEAA
jgi:hypothetical protein